MVFQSDVMDELMDSLSNAKTKVDCWNYFLKHFTVLSTNNISQILTSLSVLHNTTIPAKKMMFLSAVPQAAPEVLPPTADICASKTKMHLNLCVI